MTTTPVVPPNAPPVLLSFMQDTVEAIRQLQTPQGPSKLYALSSIDLGGIAAASYPECAVIVSDLEAIAVSTLNAGAWAWTRADGSAL